MGSATEKCKCRSYKRLSEALVGASVFGPALTMNSGQNLSLVNGR